MKNVTYINAGAGSGKTYRLTEILTNLIKEGRVKPAEVIMTTFTTKAANEIKEKAKAFLYKEGLYDAAIQLDHAMIGTVHSVCQRLIGKYWFNLGLSPDMGVMEEEDTAYYISQSLGKLPEKEELKQLRNFAVDFNICKRDGNTITKTIDYDYWREHLKSIIDLATNYELTDFTTSENKSLDYIRQFVTPGCSCSFEKDELTAVVKEHSEFLGSKKESDANNKRIQTLVDASNNLENPTIATLRNILSTIGTPKNYGNLAQAFETKMANLWVSEDIYKKQECYIKLLFKLAKRWQERFAEFKRQKNMLDFNDMEKYMCLLMQNETIANEISQSYRYLFVDEFQDSSPIQVKIFDALSNLMEHSYWVGDYKQAIYGFRGSDVALTKSVVDRVARKQDGCNTETLEYSWRSLPAIVDVNNTIFKKVFSKILEEKNIVLKKVRKNESGEDSLRYFKSVEGIGIEQCVLKLLKKGAKPGEIAVLARDNKTLDNLAETLRKLNIPASRGKSGIVPSSTYSLVSSLLRIVDSDRDSLSKATVAFLTEQEYVVSKIVEEKILNKAKENICEEEYLADVPIIRQLSKIRPRLQQQSVASLVESMIIELNLYDVVRKVEKDAAFGVSCLQTIIAMAHSYEERSVKMNMPATIDGFISYFESLSPTGIGDPNGVQLFTYHSAKGLQWKYVIMMSLHTDVTSNAAKMLTYGVNAIYTAAPSAENLNPEVYIRLTPWLYGNDKNIPAVIRSKIEATAEYQEKYNSMKEENKRLFYVGMTRPQDVLILNIDTSKKENLQWPNVIGACEVDSFQGSGACDVFSEDDKFSDFSLSPEDIEDETTYSSEVMSCIKVLKIEEPTFEKRKPKYISPSKISGRGGAIDICDFDERIPFATQPEDMSVVGDCIHQIFAGIEEKRNEYTIEYDEVIKSYGLEDVLKDKDAIVRAWNNLRKYLIDTFGEPLKTYHERPFRLERDGQTIVGSIDFVWQTEKGDVLIDFKTCPMGRDAVLNPGSEHYAGLYAGQLDAYEDALKASGENVLKRIIYYPVSGLLVEVSRS